MFNKILNRLVQEYWEFKYKFKNFISPDKKNIKVNKPIFLLGVQGGGLTLLSRILRRHPSVVSSTGNYKYWAGRDEMQNIYFHDLDECFRLGIDRLHGKYIEDDKIFGINRSWTYATNRLLDYYRIDPKQVKKESCESIQKVVQKILKAYSLKNPHSSRFLDKSQSYTLKIPMIKKCFPDAKIVLVSRDPYAMIWRASTEKMGMEGKKKLLSLDEKLKYFSEHWNNTFQIALKDSGEDIFILKYEDFLLNPDEELKALIHYLELDDKIPVSRLLPQSNNEYPLGSISREKWFPIREEINQKYLDAITPEAIKIIEPIVESTAKKLGYIPPKK